MEASKVTLRPRSKLELLIEPLASLYTVPPRPDLDVLTQLALFYLVGSGGDRRGAVTALAPLCDRAGRVDPERLAAATRADVEPASQRSHLADDTVEALHAAAELARASTDGLDARLRGDLADARRLLRGLPQMSEQRADLLLLHSGLHPVVAPTAASMQVATRIGYPGTSYGALARSLDAELPDHGGLEVAWQAHHLLEQHGKNICVQPPECPRCPVRDGCAFYNGSRGVPPA